MRPLKRRLLHIGIVLGEIEFFSASLLATARGSRTPRPKTISAQTFQPIFQSETAQSTLVGPPGELLFHSVYVHQNKIQGTLFNMILIFSQGNREIILSAVS